MTTTTIALQIATPYYILQLWVRRPLQPLQKSQPSFGPSMHSLCHPCITTTHLSYSSLSLKLRPLPCADWYNICCCLWLIDLLFAWSCQVCWEAGRQPYWTDSHYGVDRIISVVYKSRLWHNDVSFSLRTLGSGLRGSEGPMAIWDAEVWTQ